MNFKPELNQSPRIAFAIAGACYLPIAFLLFHWINYCIGSSMGYPVSYSWRGTNMWCVNARPFQKAHPDVNLNHFFYIYWGAMIVWPVVGLLIYMLSRQLSTGIGRMLQWLGVIMIVTPLYHVSMVLADTFIFLIPRGRYHFSLLQLLFYAIFAIGIGVAIFIYRRSFQKEGKKKLWLISFPVFVLCWWFWFFVLGKHLLP